MAADFFTQRINMGNPHLNVKNTSAHGGTPLYKGNNAGFAQRTVNYGWMTPDYSGFTGSRDNGHRLAAHVNMMNQLQLTQFGQNCFGCSEPPKSNGWFAALAGIGLGVGILSMFKNSFGPAEGSEPTLRTDTPSGSGGTSGSGGANVPATDGDDSGSGGAGITPMGDGSSPVGKLDTAAGISSELSRLTKMANPNEAELGAAIFAAEQAIVTRYADNGGVIPAGRPAELKQQISEQKSKLRGAESAADKAEKHLTNTQQGKAMAEKNLEAALTGRDETAGIYAEKQKAFVIAEEAKMAAQQVLTGAEQGLARAQAALDALTPESEGYTAAQTAVTTAEQNVTTAKTKLEEADQAKQAAETAANEAKVALVAAEEHGEALAGRLDAIAQQLVTAEKAHSEAQTASATAGGNVTTLQNALKLLEDEKAVVDLQELIKKGDDKLQGEYNENTRAAERADGQAASDDARADKFAKRSDPSQWDATEHAGKALDHSAENQFVRADSQERKSDFDAARSERQFQTAEEYSAKADTHEREAQNQRIATLEGKAARINFDITPYATLRTTNPQGYIDALDAAIADKLSPPPEEA